MRAAWKMMSAALLISVLALCSRAREDGSVNDRDMKSILSVLPSGASGVSVVKGSLQDDQPEKFVVTYNDSVKGTVLTILDSSCMKKFETGVATDRASKARLIDMDGDGILDIIISGSSRGGKSLQVIRSAGGTYALVGDFWGLKVKLLDEDDDGVMEIEVENRDFDRDPDRHTVHTFYRWDGQGFSPFRSYKASKRIIF